VIIFFNCCISFMIERKPYNFENLGNLWPEISKHWSRGIDFNFKHIFPRERKWYAVKPQIKKNKKLNIKRLNRWCLVFVSRCQYSSTLGAQWLWTRINVSFFYEMVGWFCMMVQSDWFSERSESFSPDMLYGSFLFSCIKK
jgi:hypothetical protein